jgi:transcriptional regulator with XRE-family HTH domain
MATAPQTLLDFATAEYIRTVAGRKRVTQAVLSEKAGIPIDTLGKYWRGQVSMTVGTLGRILDALEIPRGQAIQEIDRIYIALEKMSE